MRRISLWCRLLCFVAVYSATPGNDEAGELLDREGAITLFRGQQLLSEKGCLECHSFLGSAGAIGPDLAQVERGRSVPDVFTALWNHVPQMAQAFGDTRRISSFSEDDVRDLLGLFLTVDYLGNLGDADRGLELLSEAGCRGCHRPSAVSSSGGAADFAGEGMPGSAAGVLTGLWVKHSTEQIRNMVFARAKSGWKAADIEDLAAALRVLGSDHGRLAEPGNPASGKRLFKAWACASCHGADQPIAAEGAAPRSASENALGLLHHAAGNRPVTRPSPNVGEALSDVSDLLAYLTWKGQSLEGGDATRGARLFSDRGCGQCHRPQVEGGIAKPPSSLAAFENEYAVASAMISHAGRMAEAAQMRAATWPRLTQTEALDVIAYLTAKEGQH